ncbi:MULTISPECIES: tape measure protein [unclassified Aureimonas]|uniref:tape measure protein n=1 Tax=unclassified Aureimonas TaxID=2615206 RepID=UPI0006FE1168|nr:MULTISPECIES: tape measure protein [unclassified Aureimonas]KQT52225.1 hypothetical protein ASG62_16335 [Aureimonas sp. Leaf427]KQT70541.1 hypothetical protein ASG54_21615 [Aureimonas sp. Leaf460]
MIVDELIAVLGFDLKGEGDLKRFKNELDGAEKQANNFAAAFTKIGLAVSGVFAGLAVGNQIGNFVASITRTSAEFEKYQATLETLEGSTEKAKASLDWVTEFGRTTPYEVAEVTEAFVRLKSYGIDPMDGSLKSVGNASSAMGKSLMSGVEALADAATGEFERLKEFGVRASTEKDKVTFAWTEGGKTVEKTVAKQGDAITSFLRQNFARFNGAMDKQSKTWDGMVSNLSDSWTGFLRQIGEAGYYDDIKRRLSSVLDTVDGWSSSGALNRVAEVISNGLVGAMNTATHLATQAYRIGRGFYYAADGVISLSSRMTGLSKTATAFGMGAGLIASTAMGRSAIMAIAKRVPMVAAFLVLDDLMSGLAGDDSVIGSLEGGEAALERVRQSFVDAYAAAEGLADAINGIFNVSALAGESQIDALVRGMKEFASTEAVRFINEMADALRQVGEILTFVSGVLKNPEGAFKAFADGVIAQIDRIIAAIDEKLGGALTRFGFIGAPSVAQPNKTPITSTGKTTRAATPRIAFTPMAELEQDGRVNAEGIGQQFGVDPDRLASGSEIVMKAVLDITSYLNPANIAKAAMSDLQAGITARADLDISAFMANVSTAKQALAGLSSAGATVGRAAVQDRAAVVASPGG